MDSPDLQDIQQSLRGDGQAYARLVERYQNDIAAQMWRFTRDRLDLEELVQEVFVESYVSLRSYRGSAPFLHWLRRIATRVGYRYWKKRKQQDAHRVSLQDWDVLLAPKAGGEIQRVEAAELLEHLMSRLSPPDRLVLTLLHLEELSVAQAAQRTGWSQISVKVRAHRARKKLKALLDKMALQEGS
jgi:RNA polymerase sigma-70 factor (ECF subfamily)